MPLHPQLRQALVRYREKLAFSPSDWINHKCQHLAEYLSQYGLTATVVSVSGGIDSAVTYALCRETQKRYPEILKKVCPIAQPIHSSAWALERAKELTDRYEDELKIIDQTAIHETLCDLVKHVIGDAPEKSQFADGQLRSYLRTPVNYYYAQLMTQMGYPAIVMGTGNLDEDGYLAFFCKAGDGVVDVQLISDLHKSQVFEVGRYLGVPDSILEAAPSADLWEGQTDENELGVTYDEIELFTGWYRELPDGQRDEWKTEMEEEVVTQMEDIASRCEAIHRRNAHKLKGVINL